MFSSSEKKNHIEYANSISRLEHVGELLPFLGVGHTSLQYKTSFYADFVIKRIIIIAPWRKSEKTGWELFLRGATLVTPPGNCTLIHSSRNSIWRAPVDWEMCRSGGPGLCLRESRAMQRAEMALQGVGANWMRRHLHGTVTVGRKLWGRDSLKGQAALHCQLPENPEGRH